MLWHTPGTGTLHQGCGLQQNFLLAFGPRAHSERAHTLLTVVHAQELPKP